MDQHETQKITILGATGSIGTSTLDVISRHPQQFSLFAATANTQVERMLEICKNFQPAYAVMADRQSAQQLRAALKERQSSTEVLEGEAGLISVASDERVNTVMAAIVGSVGLQPTLSAVKTGKRVLLANKESLVMAGGMFMQAVQQYDAELLPIDSEHNAIFQSLPHHFEPGLHGSGVTKILLTGSGGPFRNTNLNEFESITPQQAVAHPNWSMGPKISVDSATMMNKGLELIEACWLFGVPQDFIEIVVHPQSIIHSMVAYNDGSVLAQMGNPDMRTPIAHALGWPERIESGVEPLDLIQVSQLDFQTADLQRFPCLALARKAFQQGGTSMAILNAANEIAVDAFLNNMVRFTDIPKMIEDCMNTVESHQAESLDQIIEDDHRARVHTRNLLNSRVA